MDILSIFFPKRCVGCKHFGEYLCSTCFVQIQFNESSLCIICRKEAEDGRTHQKCVKEGTVDGFYVALILRGLTQKLLYQFSSGPQIKELEQVLGDLFFESLIQQEAFMKVLTKESILVPLPLLNGKKDESSYLLAHELGKRLTLPVLTFSPSSNVENHFDRVPSIFLVSPSMPSHSHLEKAVLMWRKMGVKDMYSLVLAAKR